MAKEKISKRKIEKRLRTKTNPELVKAIIALKKTNPEVAKLLAMPVKKWPVFNLSDIDTRVKENESVIVPGKILSSGDLTKKIKLVAWSASEKAREKMKHAKSEFKTIVEELEKNKKLNEAKILK